MSIDRVFGHALNTVNKIRTGSVKPPVADRLALYGLYKQSMEGNVGYIASRPSGSTESIKKEQDKWDAWNANAGLSRTEAKKRYIETLIQTMHTYASTTPEARELVGELEFVWDQIKGNSTGSESNRSSPLRPEGAQYPDMNATSSVGAFDGGRGRGTDQDKGKGKMRVLSPVSQAVEEEPEDEEREEFVDAPVSQFGEVEQEVEGTTDGGAQTGEGAQDARPSLARRATTTGETKWRRRVESAIIKMTAEVAALREQLESRRYISQQRRKSLFGWILRGGWFLIRVVVADVFMLWLVILYLRRKKDRRLEGAVRVLLGDAVAQISKASRDLKVPKLAARRS